MSTSGASRTAHAPDLVDQVVDVTPAPDWQGPAAAARHLEQQRRPSVWSLVKSAPRALFLVTGFGLGVWLDVFDHGVGLLFLEHQLYRYFGL